MAERACLESMYIRKGIVGSNPTLSAKTISYRRNPNDRERVATRVHR